MHASRSEPLHSPVFIPCTDQAVTCLHCLLERARASRPTVTNALLALRRVVTLVLALQVSSRLIEQAKATDILQGELEMIAAELERERVEAGRCRAQSVCSVFELLSVAYTPCVSASPFSNYEYLSRLLFDSSSLHSRITFLLDLTLPHRLTSDGVCSLIWTTQPHSESPAAKKQRSPR